MSICLYIFLKFMIKRVFYYDRTGHNVVWIFALVLCEQKQEWVAQGCVSWQEI